MNIFGLEIKTKEERLREENAYMARIFPGGEAQREAVERELKRRLPQCDSIMVMLWYVSLRDAMTSERNLSFNDAAARIGRNQGMIKMTPEMLEEIKQVMESERQS